MNWYKRAQQDFSWKRLLTTFGLTTVLGLATLWQIDLLKLKEVYNKEPQRVEKALQQIQQQPQQDLINPKPVKINIDKIYQIESSGGKNLYNEESGATGPFQFMKPTWEEMVKRMRKNWNWADVMDYNKSRQVADYYYNIRIPELLRYFNIPDTLETRIAAYDWGIGHLNRTYKNYGAEWLSYAPLETRQYVQKYNNL